MIDTIRMVEQPAVELPIVQEVPPPADVAGEKVFSYRHGDGQEFSGTLEQAARLCPVLGRMSVEDRSSVVKKEDLMTRLAQKGRDKRLSDTTQPRETKRPALRNDNADKPAFRHSNAAKKHDVPSIIESNFSKDEAEAVVNALQLRHIIRLAAEPESVVKPTVERLDDVVSLDIPAQLKTAPVLDTSTDVRHVEPESTAILPDIYAAEIVGVADPLQSPVLPQKVPEIARIVDVDRQDFVERIQPDRVVMESSETQAVPAQHHERTVQEESTPDDAVRVAPVLVDVPANPILEGYQDRQLELPDLPALDMPFETTEVSAVPTYPEPIENTDQYLPTAENLPTEDRIDLDDQTALAEVASVEPTISQLAAEDLMYAPAEPETASASPELPAPPEAIETIIRQLGDALEMSSSDEQTTVSHTLEKIISLPANVELIRAETSDGIDKKLEALFTELFEETDIAYTSEVIRSCAKLTRAHYLEELIPAARPTPASAPAHEIGTREFLQKLYHGLGGVKQAASHVYEIGKSALRLYGRDTTRRAGHYGIVDWSIGRPSASILEQ